MKRMHLVLTGLSLVIVLLSVNRLTSLTAGTLQPHDFLRWLDFNAMIPIPLASVLLYFLLEHLIIVESSADASSAWHVWLSILLVTGFFLFAAGSGTHEVTNYLHQRFCMELSDTIDSPLCRIVAFNDDVFSHIVYYFGFIAMNVSLMLRQFLLPRTVVARTGGLALVVFNSLFIALGIFANLAFEEAALDLLFFGSVTLLSLILVGLRWSQLRAYPVLVYFAAAYTLGVGGTLLMKLV